MVKYRLVRSKRKTLSLQIGPEGLVVRAPMRMPVKEIEAFIRQKEAWIKKHLDQPPSPQKQLSSKVTYGDKILFRGSDCVVTASPDMNTGKESRYRGMYMDGEFLIGEDLIDDEIRFILSHIFKVEAEKYIPRCVNRYAEQMNLSPEKVRITSAFRQWGSCSEGKRLNFSWRLMMAEDATIDAVVVHELAHMVHMNHSKDFYALVYEYCPDYDSHLLKLNELGQNVQNEYWRQ